MRILYASAIETNADWGAESFMNAAFLKGSHETQTIDYRANRHNLAVCFGAAGDFDVFLLQRGDCFPLPVVDAIRRPRVFYFSELVARRRDADHLFRSNLFDAYLVRGPQCQTELTDRGWVPEEKVGVLLSAFDSETYTPIASPKDIDVIFVGSMTPRRIEILERLSPVCEVQVHSAFGAEAARLYNRARIVLNIHAEDYLDTETRVFEVLGTRSFLITERLSAENPFQSGVHLVEVQDEGELAEKISYFLKRPEERRLIAAQGYREALSKHTYEERVRQIAYLMRGLMPRDPSSLPAVDLPALRRYARSESLQRLMRRSIYPALVAYRRARGVLSP